MKDQIERIKTIRDQEARAGAVAEIVEEIDRRIQDENADQASRDQAKKELDFVIKGLKNLDAIREQFEDEAFDALDGDMEFLAAIRGQNLGDTLFDEMEAIEMDREATERVIREGLDETTARIAARINRDLDAAIVGNQGRELPSERPSGDV